jgi:hypothetical protein
LESFVDFLSPPPTWVETTSQAPQREAASVLGGQEPWYKGATAEVSETKPGPKQAALEAKAMAIATSAQLARALYDNHS